LNIWSIWDSRWYLSIARDGYTYLAGQQSNAAFAPGLPVLMRIIGDLFGGGADAYLIAGFVASNVALVVALGYLVALVRLDFDRATACRTVLYLLVFPSSFFLSAVYPHSLFLACAIASFYYARQDRWWLAGILGCAAGLTRLQASALIIPLAYEYLRQRGFTFQRLCPHALQWITPRALRRINAEPLWQITPRALQQVRPEPLWQITPRALRRVGPDALALALIPLGFAAFAAYLWIQSGEPLAALKAGAAWNRQLTWPWQVLGPFLTDPFANHGWAGTPTDFLFAVLLLALTGLSWRRLPTSLALFATTFTLVIVSSGILKSSARYTLEVFPIFITLATLGRKPLFDRAYVGVASLNALRLMSLFALGAWVA
jgi:hypothetical protein